MIFIKIWIEEKVGLDTVSLENAQIDSVAKLSRCIMESGLSGSYRNFHIPFIFITDYHFSCMCFSKA